MVSNLYLYQSCLESVQIIYFFNPLPPSFNSKFSFSSFDNKWHKRKYERFFFSIHRNIYLPGGGGIFGGPPWGNGCCCKGGGFVPTGIACGSTSSHSADKSPELNLKKMCKLIIYKSFIIICKMSFYVAFELFFNKNNKTKKLTAVSRNWHLM